MKNADPPMPRPLRLIVGLSCTSIFFAALSAALSFQLLADGPPPIVVSPAPYEVTPPGLAVEWPSTGGFTFRSFFVPGVDESQEELEERVADFVNRAAKRWPVE